MQHILVFITIGYMNLLLAHDVNRRAIAMMFVCVSVWPTIFNFSHLGTLVVSTERHSAQMSKIKNSGLDQYGAGLQLQLQ